MKTLTSSAAASMVVVAVLAGLLAWAPNPASAEVVPCVDTVEAPCPSAGPAASPSPTAADPAATSPTPAATPSDPAAPSASPTPTDAAVDVLPDLLVTLSIPLPLIVTPGPLLLTYGDPVPAYPFTLTDGTAVVLPETLTDYVAPVCSSEYTPTTPVADVPLPVTCMGGSAVGYTFTTEATTDLTIRKATTSVTTAPMASPLTYGQTLGSSVLSGGIASVPGSFAFDFPSQSSAPLVGTASHEVAFTPTDAGNYEPALTVVALTVTAATPTITTLPTAAQLVLGQSLASSALTGGAASAGGSFAFTAPTTTPGLGAAVQGVTFTPADTANFVATTVDVNVTVVPVPLDYATAGYLSPVVMEGATNLVRARTTVPLRFTVQEGGTALTSLATVKSFTTVAISCADIDVDLNPVPSVRFGREFLAFDAERGHFVQTWRVPATRNTCYRVTTTLADGDPLVALFRTP